MPRFVFGTNPPQPELPQPAPWGDERGDVGPIGDTIRRIWDDIETLVGGKVTGEGRNLIFRPLVRLGLISGTLASDIIVTEANQGEEAVLWQENMRIVSGYETRARLLALSLQLQALWSRVLTGAPNQPVWQADP